MGFTGFDGGIMVALAAGLWLVYLMPTWFRRREYAALEKTNVRRQQALRVLEETAPVPTVERVAAIVSPSGQVTDRDKLAEAIKRSRDAQTARVASRQYAEESTAPAQAATSKARVALRIRRTRAVSALLLIAALVTLVVQVVLMFATGIGEGAWSILGFAAVVGVVSFSALGRLASIARRRSSIVVAPVQARPMRTRIAEDREAARPQVATWTPVPLPKPMYLTRSEAAPVESSISPLESLRVAALESDRALREAQESPEVAPITKPERPAASSPFREMGIVGRADVTGPDLDEALRRRRAG
ncbi:MAG: hypothetical protein QOD50_1015 [Actinomycetota bacterium]|jgi:hypothetical protein|nr:hypothetical protein [Actinomycetota bacterium]